MGKFIRLCAMGVLFSVLFGGGLACNTTEGMGKDIKKGGENLEDSANRNK